MANIAVENRIRSVRETLKLNQAEFGSRLGVTVGVISNIELHRNKKDIYDNPILDLICAIYNVNLDWLRTGEGEMFNEPLPDEDYLVQLQHDKHLSNLDMKILRMYLTASPKQRKIISDTIDALIKGLNS